MGKDGVPLDRADHPEDGEDGGHGVDRDLDGAPHHHVVLQVGQGALPHVEAEDKPA